MSRSFGEYLKRKRAEYGEKFDASDLAPQFIPYYESGERIEVVSSWGTRRGRIGITTGWRPAFLLMCRVSARGSSDVLRADDKVTRVICA